MARCLCQPQAACGLGLWRARRQPRAAGCHL